MLVLHTLPRVGWGGLSPSPFCLKVEVYLRMLGAPYRATPTLSATRAPKGKLPYVEDGGALIADSSVIVRHLRQTRGDPLGDGALSSDERARSHLLQRTAEESLYFALVSERWREPALRARYTEALLASMPRLLRPLVARVGQHHLQKQLWHQGYGRHALDDVVRMGCEDLDAIAALLGERPFFAGDAPHAVDASLYGVLANLWLIPAPSRLREHLGHHGNLVRYVERIRARYAADAA